MDLPGKLEPLFRGEDSDNLVDHGGSGDRPLDDLCEIRKRGQGSAGNACEYQGDAGMGQECQAEVFLHGVWQMGYRGAEAGTKIFAKCAGGDIDEGVQAGAENQVVVQRCAEVYDRREQ